MKNYKWIFQNKFNYLLLPSPSILVKQSPLHCSKAKFVVLVTVAPQPEANEEQDKHEIASTKFFSETKNAINKIVVTEINIVLAIFVNFI